MGEIVTGRCQNEGSPQAPCLTTVGKPSGPGQGQETRLPEHKEEGMRGSQGSPRGMTLKERVYYYLHYCDNMPTEET